MFFRLLLSFVLFTGLLSAQENNGDKIIKSELEHYFSDTTLIEIFSTISKEYKTFLDIAPIPVFDELTDLDNENVDHVLESIRRFNDLVNNNQKILGSVEQSVKSSKDYDTCETFMIYTDCTYFRDKGDYSITVKQETTPTSNTYEVYYSGVFEGVDYGSMYLLQHQSFIGKDDFIFIWEFYQPPSPPECANQLRTTIQCITYDDGSTTYTPWGTSSSRVSSLQETFYACYAVFGKKDYHPTMSNKMTIDGNTLILTTYIWSYKKEEIYIWWLATWDFESHTGSWASFDENGIPQGSGPM